MNNMTSKIKPWLTTALVLGAMAASFVPAFYASAETPTTPKTGLQGASDQMKTFSSAAGIGTKEGTDLPTMIGQIIGGFLGVLGSVFVIIVIYAGFLWMTAGGNEEQVTKARKLMTNAVIGLIVIMMAFAITNFVTYYVAKGSGLAT
jgi:hypothetical protein